MACFAAPVTEAVVTTIVTKVLKNREKKAEGQAPAQSASPEGVRRIPFSQKLSWLNKMLWGGSALLAFEHLWHGEIVPWFPFLTAAANPTDTAEMLHEIATVGVSMSLLVTAVWLVMVAVSSAMERRMVQAESVKN